MKGKIRILFIEFNELPEQQSDEIFRPLAKLMETNTCQGPYGEFKMDQEVRVNLFDFDIFFLNDINYKYYPQNLSSNLPSFLNDGGILCTFISERNSRLIANYIDTEFLPKGEAFLTKDTRNWLWKIVSKKEHKFQWSAILKKGEYITWRELQQAIVQLRDIHKGKTGKETYSYFDEIAVTPNKKCISVIATVGDGKIIALPNPCKLTGKLLRELLDGIKNNLLKPPQDVIFKPLWINNILLPGEHEKLTLLTDKSQKLQKDIQEYEDYIRPKNILYDYGEKLGLEICNILEKIGLSPTPKEEQKRQDIEINFKDFCSIIEVKGLTKYADVDDLRELLDWWIEQSKINPDVKGIFIVNHWRDKEPDFKKEAYTTHAIQLAINNKFCLMTTVDLFKIYCEFLKGKISTENIVEIFKHTIGPLKLN